MYNILKVLNKILGVLLLVSLFLPFAILAGIARSLHFIDLSMRGEIVNSALSLILAPVSAFIAAFLAILITIEHGWKSNLFELIRTAPSRITHFFRKEIIFGRQSEEKVEALLFPKLSDFATLFFGTGFFSKLSMKFISLVLPMEQYLSYDAKVVSPHNDVSIYFTQLNLEELNNKYANQERQRSVSIVSEIKDYLLSKLDTAEQQVENHVQLPETEDTKKGKMQRGLEEVAMLKASQRCVDHFLQHEHESIPLDLNRKFHFSTLTVLRFIWLAINEEGKDNPSKEQLKFKLINTLFLIQRGFNVVNGGDGVDIPECPSGAIGLLVRVITDEKGLMPKSKYTATDPNPTNLSAALKVNLDNQFSSYNQITRNLEHATYAQDPVAYKEAKKKNIKATWLHTYAPLIESGQLSEKNMDELINAGVDAWEPPPEPTAFAAP